MLYTQPVAPTKISHPARCVVWTDASARIAPSLARVLSSRGLEPTHAASAHTALAELCLDQRAGRRPVLILDGVHDPARLLAGVERFAPDAVVWIFEPGANPPLRPVVLPNARQAKPVERSKVEIKPTQKPTPKPAAPAAVCNGTHTPAQAPPPLRLARDPGPTVTAHDPAPETRPAPPPTPPAPPPPAARREPISARDVLDDAELEMLLAGERAMEDKRR